MPIGINIISLQKPTRPSVLSSLAAATTFSEPGLSPNSSLSSHKDDAVDLLNLDVGSKQERFDLIAFFFYYFLKPQYLSVRRYLDKMKMDKTRTSPSGVVAGGGTSIVSMHQINNLLKSDGKRAAAAATDNNSGSVHRSPSIREVCKNWIEQKKK